MTVPLDDEVRRSFLRQRCQILPFTECRITAVQGGVFGTLTEHAKNHTFSVLKALKNKGLSGKLGDCKGQNFFKFLQVFIVHLFSPLYYFCTFYVH